MSKGRIIYALVDPNTQEVKYVGAAKNPKARLNQHTYRTRHASLPNSNQQWLLSLFDADKKPLIRELEHVPESEWEESEMKWIAFYNALPVKLLNITAGGQGAKTMPAEARARGVESRKRLYAEQGAECAGYGIERNAKISVAHKGRKRSPEIRAAISASLQGRLPSQATRDALIAVKIKTFTLEFRDGHFETVTNLREYCRVNGLSHSTVYGVKCGRRKSYRGIVSVTGV